MTKFLLQYLQLFLSAFSFFYGQLKSKLFTNMQSNNIQQLTYGSKTFPS